MKNKLKIIKFIIGFLFLGTIAFAIVYINKYSSQLDAKSNSLRIKNKDFLTPDYTPNSVVYKSKEDFGGITDEQLKNKIKEPNKYTRQSRLDQFHNNENKTSLGESKAVIDNPLLPKYLSSNEACHVVNSSEMFSLVKDEKEILNFKETAWWTVKNSTNQNVAIKLQQPSGKSIFVLFLLAQSEIHTKIPASQLKFHLRHSSDRCVTWVNAIGKTSSMSNLPMLNKSNPYKNSIFETKIFNNPASVDIKTEFIGYAE